MSRRERVKPSSSSLTSWACMFPGYALFLFMTILVGTWPCQAATPYNTGIKQLIVTNNQESILLFSQLSGSFNEDMQGALRDGLSFQFEFEVQVFRERRMWPDQLISSKRLTHKLKYDILKEEYLFSADYDGGGPERKTTRSSEAERWMNTLGGVEILPVESLGSGRRYFLRMRVSIITASDFFSENIFFFKKGGHYRTDWSRSPLFSITGRKET